MADVAARLPGAECWAERPARRCTPALDRGHQVRSPCHVCGDISSRAHTPRLRAHLQARDCPPGRPCPLCLCPGSSWMMGEPPTQKLPCSVGALLWIRTPDSWPPSGDRAQPRPTRSQWDIAPGAGVGAHLLMLPAFPTIASQTSCLPQPASQTLLLGEPDLRQPSCWSGDTTGLAVPMQPTAARGPHGEWSAELSVCLSLSHTQLGLRKTQLSDLKKKITPDHQTKQAVTQPAIF